MLKFSNNNYSSDTWADNVNDVGFIGWYDSITTAPSTNTITPGTGFFVFNPYGTPATLTLTGTVLQGTNSTPLNLGYTLKATQCACSAGHQLGYHGDQQLPGR